MTLQSQLTFKSLEDTSIAVVRNPIAPSQRVIAEDDDEDDDGKAAPSSAAAAPGPAGANASRKDQLDAVSSYLSHAQASGQAQQKHVQGGGGGGGYTLGEISPDKHRHGKRERERQDRTQAKAPTLTLYPYPHAHTGKGVLHEINHKVTAGRRAMGMEVERLTQQLDTMQGALDKVLDKIG